MKSAKVTFVRCEQDSQDYGSDDEHMVSRVFFNLEIDGDRYDDLHVDIKQPVVGNYETAPIEVGPPQGKRYTGPWNHNVFRSQVEQYYRSLVGSKGRDIRITGDSKDIRMRNCVHKIEKRVEFEVSGPIVSW